MINGQVKIILARKSLSYKNKKELRSSRNSLIFLVGGEGIEPPTSGM